LNILGPAAELCASYDAAVWVRDGATATVKQNRLPGSGCPVHTGIRFGSAAEPTTGSGLAQQNVVAGFETTGIAGTEAGSDVTVAGNTITGPGTAVEVAFGARGVVHANQISGADTGISLFVPAGARNVVEANTVLSSGRAIDLVDVDRTRIASNRVRANDEGIVADSNSEQNLFQSNQARGNATVDCRDESTGGFGTAGTSNTWKANRGASSEPPGICTP
jgi:hypothetical protein